jgi:hypothetical protein
MRQDMTGDFEFECLDPTAPEITSYKQAPPYLPNRSAQIVLLLVRRRYFAGRTHRSTLHRAWVARFHWCPVFATAALGLA